MHTVKLLTLLVTHHQVLAYAIIFAGLIFEGEFVIIATGILSHLGALNPYFALGFILLGGFGKTLLGYHIGKMIHKRWHDTKFMKHIEKKVFNIMPRFKQKPFWSLFISKFIMGVNHTVIIYSGYLKVPYKKYLKAEIFSTLIWAPLLLSLGYFFGYTALNISREIWRFTLIVILMFIGYVLLDRLIAWLYEIFEEFYQEKN